MIDIEAAVDIGKETFEQMKALGRDFNPVALLEVEEKIHVVQLMSESPDQLYAMIASLVELGPINAICLTVDSYVGEAETIEGIERGDLQRRFSLGDPTVSEALVVTMCHKDGAQLFAQLPYRLDGRDRTVVWLERPSDLSSAGGATPEALASVISKSWK